VRERERRGKPRRKRLASLAARMGRKKPYQPFRSKEKKEAQGSSILHARRSMEGRELEKGEGKEFLFLYFFEGEEGEFPCPGK